jgi:hypothetical protein
MTDFHSITESVREFEQSFTPSQPRILRFYNRKRKCVKTITSTDYIYWYNNRHASWQTENEYIIAIENELRQNDEQKRYSFIEVFSMIGEFIRRHYIRGNRLAPISFEGQMQDDPYLSQRLIVIIPVCDWRKVMRWTRQNRYITIEQFINQYKNQTS